MKKKGFVKDQLIFYEQLWALLGDLRIGVFTVDHERRITSFNHAAELLVGYKEREVLGKYCYEIFLNELCFGECKYHEAVEAELKSLSFDIEVTDRENTKRTITKIVTPLYNINRKPMGCIEIFQDRSTFDELIRRIRYDEHQLKSILDSLDIGIFTVTRGGHISFFNKRAEAITGYDRVEVLGKPCSVIFKDDTESLECLKLSIIDQKARRNKKGRLKTKRGGIIPIRANYMALRNDQGRTVGGLVTIQDLSVIYQLNRAIHNRYTFSDLIGKSPSMQRIFEILPVVADSDATVLIEGPTGTGKDLLAKVIHNSSRRSGKPMVKVNCAALPDNLLESEMFGYVKGAFTGADRDKPGRFQEADKGTIFLDEIGDLPLSLQAKLLRVLEDREFYPLGSRKTTKVDVRIIAATNQELERLVRAKRFREDLFYRLNVIRLELPPLKDRRDDIPLLIDHILNQLCTLKGREGVRISEAAMELMLNYDYPGNVRELENILEHALIICQGDVIKRKHLPMVLQRKMITPETQEKPLAFFSRNEIEEKDKIIETLRRHNWHRGKAAKELRIDRTTLWRKMKKYHITL